MTMLDELAKEAYHAYAKVTNWKNYQGLQMPEFEYLPDTIKQAWKASAKAIVAGAVLKAAKAFVDEFETEANAEEGGTSTGEGDGRQG